MKYSPVAHKKLNGGALYISIIIGMVTGLMLLLFILISKSNQRAVTGFCQNSQLQFDLKSGLEIARSQYFSPDLNSKWMKNEFNDDSIRIKKLSWGAFLVICIESKNRHKKMKRCGLYGTYATKDSGIVVSETTRPLSLSGKIIFNGSCYLPSTGIRPASIEGQSYINNSENAEHIKNSPVAIQEPSKAFMNAVYQQTEEEPGDSIVYGSLTNIENPFDNKTVCLQIKEGSLGGVQLKNNVKIICDGYLNVEEDCKLDNILICCKGIRFSKGFKGSVHVIASDSIISENNCVFSYPSSFVLIEGSAAAGFKLISLGTANTFYGGLFAINKSGKPGKNLLIKTEKDCNINGLVYSSGYSDIEGKLNGTMISNALMVKTSSAIYENHLQNFEVDPSVIAHSICYPPIFSGNKLMLCKEF